MHSWCIYECRKFFFLLSLFLLIPSVFAQNDQVSIRNTEVTVLVTAMPHNDRTRSIADRLQPTDFEVLEEKRPQGIISVKKAAEAPIILAVLIQDNLIGRVNNELGEIRDFIKDLPDGSLVMTAYISTGTLRVRQEFTSDKQKAADSLRILLSSDIATPFSPYLQVTDALKMFDDQPKDARRMLLMISDGLDDTIGLRRSSPSFSAYLDQTIAEAQRRGVAVFTIYAPGVGRTRYYRHAVNYGQGSLLKFSDATGGEAFFSGIGFVSFNPYFREYNELLKNQWLITYKSNNTKKGFRKIEVTTDFDIHLHHTAGYRMK